MATHDYIISNASGAAVRADLNNALAAIASNNSAATEPTTTYAYQWWADTGSSPTVMKLRNAANSAWITLFQLDGEWSLIPFENGTAAAPSIYFKDSGTDTGLFSGGTDQVNVTTGGVERVEWGASEVVFNDGGENYDFRIEGDTNANLFFVDASADRIGIGTASPSTLFHVASSAPYIRIQDTDSSTASAAQGGFEMYDSDGDRLFFLANDSSSSADVSLVNNAGGALKFGTSGSERGQFDSSGRLLVGTSTEQGISRLQVQGSSSDANGQGAIFLRRGLANASIGAGNGLGNIDFGNQDGGVGVRIEAEGDAQWGSSDYPGRLIFKTCPDGSTTLTERMRISEDGTIRSVRTYNNTTATAANMVVQADGQFSRSTSSAKYKTNIETLQDVYADSVLNCRPVWYRSTCKADRPEYGWWGFIAEEVAAIDPRLVHWKTVEIAYDEKGSAVEIPCDPEPEGVAYDRFVPHLLNLIKRQGEAIADLQAEVAALKGA
jgi:hypothetical protein